MTIKDRLSNFKQRYAELLQETQESNENWGDESYDKGVGDAIWEETRKTYRKAVPLAVAGLASVIAASSPEDGWQSGWQGYGYYSGGVRIR